MELMAGYCNYCVK